MDDELLTALNVLIWKVPKVVSDGDVDAQGKWWAAELQDKDIPVKWDEESQEFVR